MKTQSILFSLLLTACFQGEQTPPTETPSTAPATAAVKVPSQTPPQVARLGRFEIYAWEYNAPLEAQNAKLVQMGATPDDIAKYKPKLREELLKQLYTSLVFAVEAERRGLSIPPAEVDANFTKAVNPQNRPAGATDQEIKALIERDMLVDKIVTAMRAEITLSPEEVEKTYREALTSLVVAYVAVPAQADMSVVTDEEATAWASSHEADLAAAYESRKGELAVPAGAKVRYLSTKRRSTLSPEEAKKKLSDAKARVAAGEDFGAVSQALSADPAGGLGAGELGWVSAGQSLPQIEAAVQSLSAGQVSDPIETPNGLYLIQVQEKREAKTPTLAETRLSLAKAMVATEKASKEAKARAQAILDKTRAGTPLRDAINDGGSPGLALAETSLSLSDEVIPGLGADAAIVSAIKGLTKEKPTPEVPLPLGSSLYVFSLSERKDADMSAFAPNQAALTQQLTTARQKREIQEWLNTRLKEIVATGELETNEEFLRGK